MEGRWKISDLGQTLKNACMAIIRGKLLLHFNIKKHYPKVIFLFAMIAGVIWVSYVIEQTMAKEQLLKTELEQLEILHSQRVFELVSLERRSEVEKKLKGMGSGVKEMEKRVTVLE